MSIYQRGKSWYINITIQGKRIHGKVGDTKEEAEAVQVELRKKQRKLRLLKKQKKFGVSVAAPEKHNANSAVKSRNNKVMPVPKRVPEKYVEEYLATNLEVLEQGLQFKNRQEIIETGRLDIVAENEADELVFIELKTDPSEYLSMDKLCGQVSRYFNNRHEKAEKMYLVIPFVSQKQLSRVYLSLKHWIQEGRIQVYQFDYEVYRKKLTFEKVLFDI